jgi:hypothetical protein
MSILRSNRSPSINKKELDARGHLAIVPNSPQYNHSSGKIRAIGG